VNNRVAIGIILLVLPLLGAGEKSASSTNLGGEGSGIMGAGAGVAPLSVPAQGRFVSGENVMDEAEKNARLVICSRILEKKEELQKKEQDLKKVEDAVKSLQADLAKKLDYLANIDTKIRKREQELALKEKAFREKLERTIKEKSRTAKVEKNPRRSPPGKAGTERIDSIARLLEKMDTSKAAKLAENLPSRKLALVIARMKTKRAAQLLAELSSKKAVLVLQKLGER